MMEQTENNRDPECPYCDSPAKLVGAKVIYPHRPDLFHKLFWVCEPCNAYCGCHPKSTRPLGTLAKAETRAARKRAHAAFDPLWRNGRYNRTEAYRLLSEKTGIPASECHIGMMTVEQCALVVKAAGEFADECDK